MGRFSAELTADPNYQALVARIGRLEMKNNATSNMAFAQQEKRYRLALVGMNSLISLGGQVTVDVKFSSPMATTDYKVDVSIATSSSTPVTDATVTSPTVNGCTVKFTAPVAIGLGTVVGVLAISGPAK